jgi:hypothetical protein
MKKWRSESGVRKHLQKYHCPVPNASTPTTGLAESIHRDSAGSESASPIPGAALRNSATPAPTAPALDNAPELLPSSGNVRGHGDRHGADEPVLASCIAPVAVEPTGGIEENGEPEQVEEIYEDDVAAERLAETLRRMNEKEKVCIQLYANLFDHC